MSPAAIAPTPRAGGHLAWPAVLRDALLLSLLAAALGLGVNWARPSGGIPPIAREPHAILVPCPETSGRADPIEPAALPAGPGVLLLDARSAEEFAAWHMPGARSLPFDYLVAVSRDMVKQLLQERPRQVVVYGDGENPDSGEQLARQLAGAGLKNLRFVRGGGPALRTRSGGQR